jgi:hypothetical protein
MIESGSTTSEVLHLNLFGHFKPCDFTEKSKFSLISPLDSAISSFSATKSVPVKDVQRDSCPLSLSLSLSPVMVPQSESELQTAGFNQSALPLSLPLSHTPLMVSADNRQSHTQTHTQTQTNAHGPGPYTHIKKWSDLSNNTQALCSLGGESLIEKKSMSSLLETKMNSIQNLGSLSICRRYFIVEEV